MASISARVEQRVNTEPAKPMSEQELRDWLQKFGWVVPERELSDDEMSRCFHLIFNESHQGPITDDNLAAVRNYECIFSQLDNQEQVNATQS